MSDELHVWRYSFFITQWYNPTRGDWTEQVKKDLVDFDLPIDFDFIQSKSKEAFKKVVKAKAKEYALRKLLHNKSYYSNYGTLSWRPKNTLKILN